MGKQKYLAEVLGLFQRSPVVSYTSVSNIIKTRKARSQNTKQCIRRLVSSGKVKRLAKGYYTMHDDPSRLVFCLQPAYLGLQDALSFHNLSEQETIPVIITTQRVRQGIRVILGSNVLIRRINKKYFFGVHYGVQGNIALPYSDIGKTAIDMAYFNQRISRGVLSGIRQGIKKNQVQRYLARYPKMIRSRIARVLFEVPKPR